MTSGPFGFNATQDTNTNDDEKTIYLTANPDYYLGKPMVNSFAVHVYNDKDAIINALNNGSVTATAELGGSDSDKVAVTTLVSLLFTEKLPLPEVMLAEPTSPTLNVSEEAESVNGK